MVLIVKVAVTGPPRGVTEAGAAVQLASAGKPVQASITCALNPNKGLTVTVGLAEFPATGVAEDGDTATMKSAPAPPKETSCGLLGALSTRVSTPPSPRPAAVGLKITLMVHVPPAATVAQAFCCVKPVLVEIVPKIR